MSLYRRLYRDGDPFVHGLEKLGFRGFKKGEKIFVPHLDELMGNYNSRLEDLIASDPLRFPKDGVLRPARVFRDDRGKTVWIPYGDKVPRGLVPEPDILSEEMWINMLADGYMPVGEQVAASVRGGAETPFWHDLAHMTAYLKNPDYMVAQVRQARQVRGFYSGLSKEEKKHFDVRLHYASERAVVIPDANGRKLDTVFLNHRSMPKLRPGAQMHKFDDVLTHVEELSPATINKLALDLYHTGKDLTMPLGGQRRDVILRTMDQDMALEEATAYLDHGFWERLNPQAWANLDRDEKNLAIAGYQTMTANLKKMNVKDWVQGSLQKEVDPKSKVHQFFCFASELKEGSYFTRFIEARAYQAYCK